jgi:hypothetical protein
MNKNIYNYVYINNYNKRLIQIKKIKKVIYGALFNDYDKLRPFKKQEGFDYFLFTNNKIKDKTNWTILPIPEIVNNLNISIIKKQRFIKLHPHLFFVKYDISIYMDTSCVIKGDLNVFLEKILSPKFNSFFFEHPMRNSIYSEINTVISIKKEVKEKALLIMKRYKKKKFPDNYGMSENKMIIRKHNKKNCVKLMEKWWDEIYKYSHRDQLSLSYIIWKTGIKVKYISKELLYEYISIFAHIKRIKF